MQIETTASWSKLLSIVHELSSAGETEPWNPHSLEVAPSEKTHLDAVDGEWFLGCAQFVKQRRPPPPTHTPHDAFYSQQVHRFAHIGYFSAVSITDIGCIVQPCTHFFFSSQDLRDGAIVHSKYSYKQYSSTPATPTATPTAIPLSSRQLHTFFSTRKCTQRFQTTGSILFLIYYNFCYVSRGQFLR